ncbi:hypothetical protein Tco_0865017 [Tanacetum coccineum]
MSWQRARWEVRNNSCEEEKIVICVCLMSSVYRPSVLRNADKVSHRWDGDDRDTVLWDCCTTVWIVDTVFGVEASSVEEDGGSMI